MSRTNLIALPALTALLISATVMAQDYRYAVIELPRLTETYQWAGAVDVNSHGDTVGFTSTADFRIHAALWPAEGGVVDLGTLGGQYSGAIGINEAREICGWAVADPNGSIFDTRAFLWRQGQMSDLGTLGGEDSYAFALNDNGLVVGEAAYELTSGRRKAFEWVDGEMEELPGINPEFGSRVAFDINADNEVVGYGLDLQGQWIGLLWSNGQVVGLPTLGGDGATEAYGINEKGVIVGHSHVSEGIGHAVKWVNGHIVDIHTSSIGTISIARGINNSGQIVGDAYGGLRAFILNTGEQMMLLDDLVPPRLSLDWTMQRASHINDAGQIPVTAEYDGDTWALLLTPVNPMMSLQDPVPGSAGTVNRLRVTGAPPGARVYFCYSRHGGGTRIPGCDLQQNALQLDNPTVIGSTIADQDGVASITRPVPLIARGQTILFQAVVQNECAISQLVVHEFQ
ncbi:MAG: hypothetical protein IT430_07515 [Phycisphaerales bacterium]|nr:hypothetical protein [Phycisphaerales bacterium]